MLTWHAMLDDTNESSGHIILSSEIQMIQHVKCDDPVTLTWHTTLTFGFR